MVNIWQSFDHVMEKNYSYQEQLLITQKWLMYEQWTLDVLLLGF